MVRKIYMIMRWVEIKSNKHYYQSEIHNNILVAVLTPIQTNCTLKLIQTLTLNQLKAHLANQLKQMHLIYRHGQTKFHLDIGKMRTYLNGWSDIQHRRVPRRVVLQQPRQCPSMARRSDNTTGTPTSFCWPRKQWKLTNMDTNTMKLTIDHGG